MSEDQVSLLIKEPGAEETRIVRAPNLPFILGDSPDADIKILGASAPVKVQFSRRDGKYYAGVSGNGSGGSGRNLPLKHGSRLKTGGVRIQFLTRALAFSRRDRRDAGATVQAEDVKQERASTTFSSPPRAFLDARGVAGDLALEPAVYPETNATTAVLTRNEAREQSPDPYHAEPYGAHEFEAGSRLEDIPVVESTLAASIKKAKSYLRTLDRLREKLDTSPDFLHS